MGQKTKETTFSSRDCFGKDVGEVVKEKEGQLVNITFHLQTHISKSQLMLCAGETGKGYTFISSLAEEVDGTKTFYGLMGMESHTSYNADSSRGTFLICNGLQSTYPSTAISVSNGERGGWLSQEEFERIRRLWNSRELPQQT
jgi:hypothetical protein